ncbi:MULTISPECIES: mechanosensitive ion channel family protein [Capnocytophaga]|jgi:mscS mechanosensitive ion channel|uniref:Mechanosensitive ion channel n=1 Tax=Capnocytophaga genosp. AHN8471 TaxID=327574 RepID=A0ABS1YXF2_9FLAO|nr:MULTISPECIES: mechanosensitive ion channel family protein [Capnocytophaga]EKY21232.1 transporter, small conductance mechanosensitive ion channel MscS family protein [Capnocytophaga sp. oral taxon 326 str. F0382]MBI1667307.1 mechanosensitive ion channel [Capnocytophaga periodontitidis]MBM0651073.1 mechanosensitive ion channel [Capnocytophaga genosp. AHN8471]MBM0653483.1 mechanosensitive ion channel [Capnocytophaga genosp. AHN8471]MBM0658535.1 mechanosensitive ion channel [Capnocytophaga geno
MKNGIVNDYINIIEVFTKKIHLWIQLFIDKTPNIVIALLVFILGFYLSRLIKKIAIRILERRGVKPSSRIMLGNIISVLVVITFFMFSLNILDLENMFKTILAGAGVAGLAIGLALQGTLSNTFSGITLSFSKSIRIGHQIETMGYTGTIEDINLRTIKLKMADGNYVSIPNKLIVDNPMKNYSESDTANVLVTCGVGYESDLEQVKILTETTIRKMMQQKELDTAISFYYTEFADSAINFSVYFTIPSKKLSESFLYKSEAIMAIKKCFDAHNINIPFPIRTVQMDKQ